VIVDVNVTKSDVFVSVIVIVASSGARFFNLLKWANRSFLSLIRRVRSNAMCLYGRVPFILAVFVDRDPPFTSVGLMAAVGSPSLGLLGAWQMAVLVRMSGTTANFHLIIVIVPKRKRSRRVVTAPGVTVFAGMKWEPELVTVYGGAAVTTAVFVLVVVMSGGSQLKLMIAWFSKVETYN